MCENEKLRRLFLTDCTDLIDQSLIKLFNCLEQLETTQIWWRPNPDCNSIGNLVLHVCGNLRQWTVSGIAGLPDTRDREREFAVDHAYDARWLCDHLKSETLDCKSHLQLMNSQLLLSSYCIQGFSVNGLQAVNHTVTHFVGHTHQVVYVTRLILGEKYRFAWSPDDDPGSLPI